MFTTWFIACVASLSARVSREQKREIKGKREGRRETFPSSLLPIHLLPFFLFALAATFAQ